MGEEKSNVVITEEGALSVKKLTFWEAAMIIVGANIGAGILGLAYSSREGRMAYPADVAYYRGGIYDGLHAVCG